MFPLAHMLKRFVQIGTLNVIDAHGKRHCFGGGDELVVTLRLHDAALHRRLFFNPDLALGEAYMEGTLTFEESSLHDLLQLFHLNRQSLTSYPLQAFIRPISRLLRSVRQYNPIGRAQKNVSHHYDLSREMFELFLDDDMQYSCAYFANENDTLKTAQQAKKQHIINKLQIEPGQRVLDIGCGWGGMAIAIAQQADVEVVGVTLSIEQQKVARERADALGLADRVRFELQDYRELDERFDRIVSVGMFEHVGLRHYPEFFAKVDNLLTDDGVMLLHSIGRMGPPGTTGPWLRKYIFPGGHAPSMSEVFEVTERQRLWVTDLEILRLHYAETLKAWQTRFEKNRQQIADLYDERFCRMWEFYLICAEMLFRQGSNMVFQMQLARNRAAVPQTRDYIYENAVASDRDTAAAA